MMAHTRETIPELVGRRRRAPRRGRGIVPHLDLRRDEADTLVPLEAMNDAPDARTGLIAGDLETKDIFLLDTPLGRACLHTSKGVGYKDVNEDGGALFADEGGRLYLGVFDQAGGMGSKADERGAASAIAARRFFENARALALNAGADVASALRAAALEAHHEIRQRGYDEATTFVAARIDGHEAIVVVVGDSGAHHYHGDGELVTSTKQHRLPPPLPQNILTDAVGQSTGEPHPDAYRWTLSPGDILVLGSDGLLDALGPDEIAAILRTSPDPADATRALREEVYARMQGRQVKSDNVTIGVLRLAPPSA